MKSRFTFIQRYLDRPWYPIALGAVAAADLIVIIIPIDGLTVAAVAAAPKRWPQFALGVSLGNTLGCALLAQGVYSNAAWISERFSFLMHSQAWEQVELFIQSYGVWAVTLGAASPIPLQIWVIVPALAKMSAIELITALLIGRVLRSLILCWIASHVPKLLLRSRSIQKEIHETQD
ncbi:MAG: hypothetical protein KGQ59_05925 [Bdellovibrionales bacterium]|nr:hypothetical protein [Bdellovibrionales bacterium]